MPVSSAGEPSKRTLRLSTITFDGKPAELVASGVSLGVHAHDLPAWLEGFEEHP